MLKQQTGYTLQKTGSRSYLLPYGQKIADQKPGISLNETGELLWNALDTPQSIQSLAEVLSRHYQIDASHRDNILQDVSAFVQQMSSLGMITEDLKPQHSSCSRMLLIAGLKICLSGSEPLYIPQFHDFNISDDFSESPADMNIELLLTAPLSHQNGIVLLRNRELTVLQGDEYYILLFPGFPNITEVYLTFDGKYARIYCKKMSDAQNPDYLFHVMRHLILYRFQLERKFALHSASILYRGKAWLFSGHSGIGKSTHTALWNELLGTPFLNGDLNLIGFQENTPNVYGIPWCGTSGLYTTTTYPLGGIILLARGSTDTVETLTPEEKTLKVMQRLISPAWDSTQLQKNLLFAQQLTEQIPVYHLYCTKSPSAVSVIRDRIDEDFFNSSTKH